MTVIAPFPHRRLIFTSDLQDNWPGDLEVLHYHIGRSIMPASLPLHKITPVCLKPFQTPPPWSPDLLLSAFVNDSAPTHAKRPCASPSIASGQPLPLRVSSEAFSNSAFSLSFRQLLAEPPLKSSNTYLLTFLLLPSVFCRENFARLGAACNKLINHDKTVWHRRLILIQW
jgi:hypothetical protein